MESTGSASIRAPRTVVANAVDKGISLWYPGVHGTIDTFRTATYTSEHFLDGTVFPAVQAVVGLQEQLAKGFVGTLRGDSTWKQYGKDTWDRFRAGARFRRLVNTMGKELFGSARFAGETVLAENDYFTLTYIPAKEGTAAHIPLFHVGGTIPYGDRLFRLLPEANFYGRFIERGMPVYTMELRGDRYQNNYSSLTLAGLVDSIERMSAVAYRHAGRKMVLEGYCGHGLQALAYLAAKPEDAEEKLCAVAFFVSPIHGPDCATIADFPQRVPASWAKMQTAWLQRTSGYVPGDSMRISLDLALKKNFVKTPMGQFFDGWNQAELAHVRRMEDLSAGQRKMLAGAYWISADNGNRFPIPVDLSRYATAMFVEGISKQGDIPFRYQDKPLSLSGFLSRTSMPVIGFYGGTDPMIPDRTAFILMDLLKERYQHVVHPNAGHISYVFSASQWEKGHKRAFRPNPIDVLLTATGSSEAENR
ncbi:MAG TPA: hypothetical protein PLJ27_19400 [Polyangiaceae bacterium]|jgi:pimeloyl-ACP methyl ester carboxylesterase|nr:MAG: Alpha/beta hydrolase family protein [Deltaproteobacteria bacterium ADurb.Bin207]HNS98648.1 hypothetical protein [Polyangiaceae bacterium]HNZ21012.1 hypothetical protein [Polyangiaceae bacterium]HOD24451.1 hypothetical protein [Polyangiaceae bacterium]HOE48826.1 hypothetical protein [Polyangiaceae bacterium]